MVPFEPRQQLLTVNQKSWRSNFCGWVQECNISSISFAKFKLPGLESQILVLSSQPLCPCKGHAMYREDLLRVRSQTSSAGIKSFLAVLVVTENCCNVLGLKKFFHRLGSTDAAMYAAWSPCLVWQGNEIGTVSWNMSCLHPWWLWGNEDPYIEGVSTSLSTEAFPISVPWKWGGFAWVCPSLLCIISQDLSWRCIFLTSAAGLHQPVLKIISKLYLHNPIFCRSLVFLNSNISISFSFYRVEKE